MADYAGQSSKMVRSQTGDSLPIASADSNLNQHAKMKKA
jgi:hypothetical protein